MVLEEYLSLVLPAAGHHCVMTIKPAAGKNVVRHRWFDPGTPFAEIAADIRALDEGPSEVYIALAGFEFEDTKSRAQNHAAHVRSLWLDIDCGTGKPYATKPEAVRALEAFVRAARLPRPYIVQSGNGIHVYWPFDRDVAVAEWKALAARLKALSVQHGFEIDMSVTADAARVLRPIETTHKKDPSRPRPVKLVMAGQVTTVEQLQTALGTQDVLAGARPAHIPDQFRSMMTLDGPADPAQFSAKKIMATCQQFRWAAEHQQECDYTLWRLLITTLYRSDDPEMIHAVSREHPDYDADETVRKAADWGRDGAATCKRVEEARPHGCNGCVLHGQNKSPSSLAFIKPPEPPLPKIDEATGMPSGWQHDDAGYFIMAGQEGDRRVDLFPGTIQLGDVFGQYNADGHVSKYVPVRASTMGGVREGTFSAAKVASDKDMLSELLRIGIAPHGPAEKAFIKGMRAWVQQHLNEKHQAKAVTQLGWNTTETHRTDASFVLGNQMYKADGTVEAVKLDTNCAMVGQFLTQHGTLAEWIEIQKLYNKPAYRKHKVVFWATFAAPLARLMGIPFPIMHTFSPDTGVGKTGLQRAQVSFWGNPRHPWGMIHADATPMLIRKYETVLNGIICNVDEISRMESDASAAMVYEATHLSGRLRLNSTGSMQEATPAQGLKHTTGNVSLKEIMQTARLDASPLTARVWEITLQRPQLSFEEHEANRQVFSRIDQHYGVAAPTYVAWLVTHQAEVQKMLRECEHKLRSRYQATDDERFWISLEVCLIVGATIAKNLGLIDHDIPDGVRVIVANHLQMRTAMRGAVLTPELMLMRFVQENQGVQLTVDRHKPLLRIGDKEPLSTTIRKPNTHTNVQMRYATVDKMLFVAKDFMRRWFAERGLDFTSFCDAMQERGVLKGESRITLTAYTTLKASARPMALWFDLSKLPADMMVEDDGYYEDGVGPIVVTTESVKERA